MGRAERIPGLRVCETGLPAGRKPFNRNQSIEMNKSKCPHCGTKLGNFMYADMCPHCHEELKHNTRPLSAQSGGLGKANT